LNPSCTLVIATYNWPSALRLCLKSVLEQTRLPNEVIIADDGSGPDTETVVQHFAAAANIPVHHIWQPDEGYRLARIRNKAFAAAQCDYILQVDGDLILHRSFVEDHLAFCRPAAFISGTRVLLPAVLTEQILQQGTYNWNEILSTKLGKSYNGKHVPLLSRLLYHFQKGRRYVPYVLGCNMAFWRSDLQAVNGYNEDFQGWGKEDNDISARLINAGVQLHFLKFGGIVYHLYHKEAARPTLAENQALLEQSLINQITYIRKGLDQHR
jgi:glycosyltransferase involved in cell wall biosynthesis